MKKTIAICGAGIAGVATAYYLARKIENVNLILIDKHQALTFTSSKSGENFRDYWPHHSMEALSSRSIRLMTELKSEFGNDAFAMEFSGYHFVSHDSEPIFTDENSMEFLERNDVVQDAAAIHDDHPYLDAAISKSVFIKNAGHVDSITMANVMLTDAKKRGLTFQQLEIVNLVKSNDRYDIHGINGRIISADKLIFSAGPFINQLAKQLELSFPIWNTLQRKFIIPDPQKIIPRDMPFTIYVDGQTLSWSIDEKSFLQSNSDLKWMTEEMPGAIHIKPEGGDRIKLGWAFSTEQIEPEWNFKTSDYFPQIVLKGASRFIPALAQYAENIPSPVIEYGGYYTRTKENWPLIGPTELDNVYVVGALAGFGTMAACAAGELCASYLVGEDLPEYAAYFHPARYSDPNISSELKTLTIDGQL